MSFWNFCFDWLGQDADLSSSSSHCGTASFSDAMEESLVNPASGLPMTGGMGGVDVAGNPWGTDLHDDWHNGDLSSMGSGFGDDGWSSGAWPDDSGFGNTWNNDD